MFRVLCFPYIQSHCKGLDKCVPKAILLQIKQGTEASNYAIEHIKGLDNIPADVFSRLIPRSGLIVNNIVLSRCTTCQHDLLKACDQHHYAHRGVQKTLNLFIFISCWGYFQGFMANILKDVRDFIQCCPTCKKCSFGLTFTKAMWHRHPVHWKV